nr:hypothetical protein [Tanacetum cinerariifolium]
MVEEPKPLKKQAQIKQDEAYARELERYQAIKRKPQTEAQARKNMMIYQRNVIGFKMDYFKEITYDDIRPIFEKKFNSNVAFLQKTKEQMDEEDSRALKRQIPNDDDDVYTEATPLARKELVKERFTSSKPKNFSDDFLLTTLTYMFEKPDVQAQMILLVERRYPFTRFTLDQMLNNVRLEVEEESKPQTEAQARKNMMIYLRNVAGFKMDYFKGMTYDDIRPIFKKKFNSNVAFLAKTKEQMEEEDSRAFKRLSESQEDKAAKKQNLDEEVEELKRHL